MEDRKKLLVTASTFPRWESDTEPRFILDYAKAISEYYDVTVLVPAAIGAKNEEMLEGIHVKRYHYFPIHKWETLCYPGAILPRIKEKKARILLIPFLLLSLWWHLLRMISNYDVIHAHWLIPQGIVQSFFRKSYIVTGHGGDITSLNKGIIRKLKIRSLKKAQAVTVVSGHLKNQVQELVNGIEADVISMGVDSNKFGKKYYVPNFFGQGSKKVILFVGRLAEKKGVTYLVEAMEKVDAFLVIVGDGPLRLELEEQAFHMKDKIQFLGAKTHDELKQIYASADILVVPSITAENGDQEGLPTVIMEAFASKLAVIATRTGGIPELVTDNENGVLVEEKSAGEISDAINRLLSDEVVYDKIASNAYKSSKDNDYNRVAEEYNNVIKKSLNN